MPRWVLHVDLDQFLAAVEVLRRPELAGRPVIVGGDGDPTKRGVVSTCSYEARAFGVRSGMALRIAARRCPDAIFLPVDFPVYEAASREVMDTLRTFEGVVEVAGWDEAFMAVASGDPVALAHSIREAVLARTRLSCSIGIGDNKLQAKIATEMAKPAGVFMLTSETWHEIMDERSPGLLWGIGKKRVAQLRELGIRTIDELARADEAALSKRFGPQTGPWLQSLGRGESNWPVSDEPWVRRSYSREETFQQDLADPASVREAVERIAGRVAADVAEDGRAGVRVVVKLRFAPFITKTLGAGMETPGVDPDVIRRAALAALERFTLDRPVRLVGVRVELER